MNGLDYLQDPLERDEPATQALATTYSMPTPFPSSTPQEHDEHDDHVSTDSSVCTDDEDDDLEYERRTEDETAKLLEASKGVPVEAGTDRSKKGRILYGEEISSEFPGPICMGCDSLDCILEWKSIKANFPRTQSEAIAWMDGHKFFVRRVCPNHPKAKLKYCAKGGYFTCTHNMGKTASGTQQQCRRRVGLLEPFKTNKLKSVGIRELLEFWALMADNVPTKTKANLLGLNHCTISALTKATALACHALLEQNPLQMTNVQVDETYIGKRKDHRGRKARNQGYWFVSVTEVCQKSGRSLRTRWYPVTFRTKEELTRIVRRHLASAKTVVTTDSFRSYNYLSEICRHKQVNHKVGFVAKDEQGRTVHTNNAEGVHSVMKSWCKKEHNRYGLGSANLQRNIAIQTVKFDKDGPEQVGCWQKRYINILRAVRAYYTHEDIPDIPEIKIDKKSPYFKEHKEDWRKRYAKDVSNEEVHLLKDVTIKKVIDGKVKFVRSNQIETDPFAKWKLEQWQKDVVRDAVKTCEPGYRLDGAIINLFLPVATGRHESTYRLMDPEWMRWVATLGSEDDTEALEWANDMDCDIIAPVLVDNNHWILLVWSAEEQKLNMYDSLEKTRPEFTNWAMRVFSSLPIPSKGNLPAKESATRTRVE